MRPAAGKPGAVQGEAPHIGIPGTPGALEPSGRRPLPFPRVEGIPAVPQGSFSGLRSSVPPIHFAGSRKTAAPRPGGGIPSGANTGRPCTAAPACFPPYTPLCPAGGQGVCFFPGEEKRSGRRSGRPCEGPGMRCSRIGARRRRASGAFGYHGRLRAAPKAAPAFCLFRQLILFPWCCTIGSKEASKWTTLKRWRNGSARAGTS